MITKIVTNVEKVTYMNNQQVDSLYISKNSMYSGIATRHEFSSRWDEETHIMTRQIEHYHDYEDGV